VKVPGGALVDIRADQLCHGEGEIFVFYFAACSAPLGQEVLFDDIGKQFLVGAVSDTQHIVSPLGRRRMLVRKCIAGRGGFRSRHLHCAMVGGPQDHSAGLVLAEPQHDVRGELIGDIFLPTQHRHLQHAKNRVPGLVQEDIQNRTDDRVRP
jgi:hypothetical protein